MACPICDRPTEARYRPFCSKRCADRDLGKWLTGGYAIPSDDPDDAENLERELRDAPDGKPH
ncbi:DNA gyrase inhibitor YacG [Yoonia sp. R2-816]|uniref:DNA gyrase inhibitor YacG n=1 Tax=Yoonia sp. R2-816 TaxID=3342638 RepID=UPI00372B5685